MYKLECDIFNILNDEYAIWSEKNFEILISDICIKLALALQMYASMHKIYGYLSFASLISGLFNLSNWLANLLSRSIFFSNTAASSNFLWI